MTAVIDEKHNSLTCPFCEGKMKVADRRPVATVRFDDEGQIPASEWQKLTGKVDEIDRKLAEPKVETKTKYPDFMPGMICKDGNCGLGGVHDNPGYTDQPRKQCKNCDQLGPGDMKKCPFCRRTEFNDVTTDDLVRAGIKLPSSTGGHDHEH